MEQNASSDFSDIQFTQAASGIEIALMIPAFLSALMVGLASVSDPRKPGNVLVRGFYFNISLICFASVGVWTLQADSQLSERWRYGRLGCSILFYTEHLSIYLLFCVCMLDTIVLFLHTVFGNQFARRFLFGVVVSVAPHIVAISLFLSLQDIYHVNTDTCAFSIITLHRADATISTNLVMYGPGALCLQVCMVMKNCKTNSHEEDGDKEILGLAGALQWTVLFMNVAYLPGAVAVLGGSVSPPLEMAVEVCAFVPLALTPALHLGLDRGIRSRCLTALKNIRTSREGAQESTAGCGGHTEGHTHSRPAVGSSSL